MKRFLPILMFALPYAHAAKVVTHCSISEILASGQSHTTQWKFDGTEQYQQLTTSLLKGVTVKMKGSPGSAGELQAFYLAARIIDSETGATSVSESYYIKNQKYSPKFASVVRGTFIVHLHRPNGDKMEVSCFNPER